MNIGATVLYEKDLSIEIVKEYFQTIDCVLKVSEIINNKNVIDYQLLKSKMPSVIEERLISEIDDLEWNQQKHKSKIVNHQSKIK